MSDSSDDDVSGFISPSSIRPSMRRDVGMGSARQSTIVKAAARRQLRGDSDKKPVKEVAAEYRKKFRSDEPDETRKVVVRRRGNGTGSGSGKNVGIGIKFKEEDGKHFVTSFLPDGPAHLTRQIFEGDEIVAVDDVLLAGKSSDEVIDLILGPPGDELVLTMQAHKQAQLSPGFQQTPVVQNNRGVDLTGISPELKSMDSPASKEFELVAPGQVQQGSASTKDCSVGVRFVMDKKLRVKVHEIIPGMSADECKRIHVGDVLLRVDGVEVSGKEASAIETLVAGPTGSPVSLTLESGHDRERRSVRLTRSETISGPFITSETQEADSITPAPVEPSPEVSRRPDPVDVPVSLARFQEMEKRLEQLEKKMDQKNDPAQKLSSQITDLQASLNKRLGQQEKALSELQNKKGCACVVS